MSNETINASSATERALKHINLNEAIDSINQLKRHAEDVLTRITGCPNPPEVEEKNKLTRQLSLEEILNEGPDRIRGQCDEIYQVLDQISQKLF